MFLILYFSFKKNYGQHPVIIVCNRITLKNEMIIFIYISFLDFLASAFTNLIALNVSIISSLYIEAQPWETTIIYCKLRGYIMNASLQMSRYLIMIACFDRYALCSTNAYLRRFCRVDVARRYVIPCIILIWLIIPLYVPIYTTVQKNTCVLIGVADFFNTIYGIVLIGIVPPVVMFIFSLLIFHNLKLRQRRQQIHPSIIGNANLLMNKNRRAQIKDQQVLAMLLIQVLAYGVSSTPYTIIRLYLVLTNDNESTTSFILFITDMLHFICPFVSFYLFILVSHLYRKEMRLILLSIYHRCNSLWKRNNDYHYNMNLARNSITIGPIEHRQQPKQAAIQLTVTVN
jgi:hypothetical protein